MSEGYQDHSKPSHLPTEMWSHILSCLPPMQIHRATGDRNQIEYYQTLINLCLVSKQLQAVAEPLIYRDFTTRLGIPLCNFAFAVIDNPRLCGHVRDLEIDLELDETAYYRDDPADEYWEPRPHIITHLECKARQYGITQATGDCLLEKLNDISIKLLCLTLPHLEFLDIKFSSFAGAFEKPFSQKIPRMNYDHTPRIKDLTLYSFEDEQTSPLTEDMSRFAGLYAYPEQIYLFFDHPCNSKPALRSDGVTQASDVYRNVKKLYISYDFADKFDIKQLVSWFPSLEYFTFHGRLVLEESIVSNFGSFDFVEALQPIKDNLRELDLQYARRRDGIVHFIPSFESFRNLEQLQVESFHILQERARKLENDERTLGAEAENLWRNYFPSTLQRLGTTHCYRNIEAPLLILAERVREWMPCIEHLRISIGDCKKGNNYKDFDADGDGMYEYVYEPIVTDSKLLAKLNSGYVPHELVEISHRQYGKVSIPASFLVDIDYQDPVKTSKPARYLTSIRNYFYKSTQICHLPPVWGQIIAKFGRNGVRITIDNQPYVCSIVHGGGQMTRVRWTACYSRGQTLED